jgi:Na+:H+ antiporter, NhaC family
LRDAILPVVVLMTLGALMIARFGVSATEGPWQVAWLLSATFASNRVRDSLATAGHLRR